MCNVNIPKKDNSNLELTLEAGKTTIIIGANGSGKTRLAVFLEEQLGEKAHRIAAHIFKIRSLSATRITLVFRFLLCNLSLLVRKRWCLLCQTLLYTFVEFINNILVFC